MNTDKTNILETVDDLKKEISCSACNNYQNSLCRLSCCPHLVCDNCFAVCTTCSICGKRHRSKTLKCNEDLNKILSYVDAISDIKETTKNDEDTQVTYLFASTVFNYKRHHNGETRLHKECQKGKYANVEELLLSGMDVNVQDYAGWTPLHEAVVHQHINIVTLLLSHGALVNVPGLNYTTPLHTAVQMRNSEIVKVLMEYGANCMSYNKDGKTPINLCEEDNTLKDIICLTLTKPCIFRTYTTPDLKLYLHNFDEALEKHLSTKSDITIMKKHNLVKFGDVKYFVLGDAKFDTKQLQAAMLQGACIVTVEFANNLLLQNRTMNPMNYFANVPGFQIAKAGVNSLNKLPKLFDGIHFYFDNLKLQEIGDVQYAPDDIKSLILLGGGKVDTRSPTSFSRETYYPYHSDKSTNSAATNYYLLHHESKNFKKKIYYNETKYRTMEWLINCINNFSILPN